MVTAPYTPVPVAHPHGVDVYQPGGRGSLTKSTRRHTGSPPSKVGTSPWRRWSGSCHARPMPRTDSASRAIPADPERVFTALVDPDALAEWLPPTGMTGRFERFDARPGGSYRLVLTYTDSTASTGKATAGADIVEARFVEIVPGVRVVQAVDFVSDDPAFAGTMTMTWAVSAQHDGTRVEIRAEDVPVGISAEDHAVHIASSLDNLAAYLEVEVGPARPVS